MRRLLVLRPEPGASETAAGAAAAGWHPVLLPLFETRSLAWSAPAPEGFDAIMLTSAAAARLGGAQLALYRRLPVYAVGAASAAAARAAGFGDVRAGAGDAADLLAQAVRDGVARLLHLAGREHRTVSLSGVMIRQLTVYAADETDPSLALTEQIAAGAVVAMIHSPRAGARFAELVPSDRRPVIAIAAISADALTAADTGWARTAIAAQPTDAALLAAAEIVCDQPARE